MKLNELNTNTFDDAKNFVKKIYSEGSQNPLGRGVIFGLKNKTDEAMIKVLLTPMSDGTVHISELIVLDNKIKKGFGSYIMSLITKEADKDNITLNLFAEPIKVAGQKSIPKNKLISFYKKYGFVSERKDEMIRKPK